MARKPYPAEFLKWVETEGRNLTCTFMAAELYRRHGRKVSPASFRNYIVRRGYKFKRGTFIRGCAFEEWQQDYIAWFSPHMTDQELSDRFLLVYNVKHSAASIKSFRTQNKIKSGRSGRMGTDRDTMKKWQYIFRRGHHVVTEFKKGEKPWNTKELGTESKTSDGYIVRKVENGRRWKLRARIVWEEHNGPIPEGMRVIHLDGNKENDSIENLALCSFAESFNAVRAGMIEGQPELNKAILNIEKLKLRLGKTT